MVDPGPGDPRRRPHETRTRWRGRGRKASAGYALVFLAVAVTISTMLVMAAFPLWSQIIRRQKEKELIFRGLQYAEAIRVFQLRNGRFPVRLEELIEVYPRSIRQLWKDPMTESGEWGLIMAQAGARRQRGVSVESGREQGQRQTGLSGLPDESDSTGFGRSRSGFGERGETVTVGPIMGVHSKSQETGVHKFFGSDRYQDWQFTVTLLPQPQVMPDTLNIVGANSDRIGRTFPDDLNPMSGRGPDGERSRTGRQGDSNGSAFGGQSGNRPRR